MKTLNDSEYLEDTKAHSNLMNAAPFMLDALDAIASACNLQSVSPGQAEEVFKAIGRTAQAALNKARGKHEE